MKNIYKIFLLLLFFPVITSAQDKIKLTQDQILKELPTGIINNIPIAYDFLDNTKLLIKYDNKCYSYDVVNGTKSEYTCASPIKISKFENLVDGWKNPTFSPDSTKIAYTKDNDLYSLDVNTREIIRYTYDGSDLILNGWASWVYYEEILGRASHYKAFWWSPDSKILAFYKFDNKNVPVFPIFNSVGQHGSLNETRYPSAGDSNPELKIGFVSAGGGEVVWADFDSKKDQYFGIPFWNSEGNKFMVAWMNRSQDDLELFALEPYTGEKESIYKEHQDTWIDWMEGMLFTKNGIYIVRDFEMWEQIYYLTYDGTKFEKLTTGNNWGITLLKVDQKYLYYTAKKESSTRVDIYRVTLKNKKVERVSFDDLNFSNIIISPDARNIVAVASNAHTPNKLVNISIPKSGNLKNKIITTIADSKGEKFDDYDIALPEILFITTRDGYKLPVSVTWPVAMNKTKKYPVIVSIYGGPNSPQVRDRWSKPSFSNQWWANNGVIQLTLDTRSSGHLGKEGMNQVYRYLGILELQDFIDEIKYFTALPFVDKDKIGIEGFSYGGTMAALAVTEGNEYFKYGIAGGGVYDWQLYDTHYAERYMDRPVDNPDGYAKSMVYNRIENYKGDKTNMLRLTHGTGDDNVHFQNTLQLIDKLQQDGKNFELMIYPQGMHGYRGYQRKHSDMQDYIFWYKYLMDRELPEVLINYFK
ncbi:MAG: S9 family peptidase [Bacteroidales bacterium]|nr:S9 family peptidase [Bacteroidales bacterium]